MQKSKAIVIDIDGVILDSDLILKEIYDLKLKGDAMWSHIHSNCNGDRVTFLSNITSLLSSLDSSVAVVLSTSRNECCREGTEKRLHEEGYDYINRRNFNSFMRFLDDARAKGLGALYSSTQLIEKIKEMKDRRLTKGEILANIDRWAKVHVKRDKEGKIIEQVKPKKLYVKRFR